MSVGELQRSFGFAERAPFAADLVVQAAAHPLFLRKKALLPPMCGGRSDGCLKV